MLINVLLNTNKYMHHTRLINILVKKNILMHDMTVSDKGGCIVRDAEYYTIEMNAVLRSILKKG